MIQALLGLVASVALWALIRRGLQPGAGLGGAGVALLAGGGALLLARQPGLAAVAAALGAALLAWAQRSGRRGRASTVRTATLEMMLDHDSGAMEGLVLRGAFAGRMLSDLTLEQLLTLAAEIDAGETQTLSLLHAWLDRAHPDWRDAQDAASPASGATSGAMTRAQALEILGLREGADEGAVEAAWRRLMKRVHPDVGGSEALVAQVTAARDRLLR